MWKCPIGWALRNFNLSTHNDLKKWYYYIYYYFKLYVKFYISTWTIQNNFSRIEMDSLPDDFQILSLRFLVLSSPICSIYAYFRKNLIFLLAFTNFFVASALIPWLGCWIRISFFFQELNYKKQHLINFKFNSSLGTKLFLQLPWQFRGIYRLFHQLFSFFVSQALTRTNIRLVLSNEHQH